MKKALRILATISIAITFITLFNSLFLINANLVREIEVNIQTGNTIGINSDPSLSFGILPPGSSSTKRLIIENKEDKKIMIKLKAEGSAKELLEFEENNFYLNQKETKQIDIIATAPITSKNEEYTGKVKICTSKK